MVITFPNMGNIAVGIKTLCQSLEIDCIIPNRNNKKTLQTGSYYSPEEICLPFKLIIGNIIEGVEQGADTVLITGSCGPCRFGEYCELLMEILQRMGYRGLRFIVLDLSPEIGRDEFLERIGYISDASHVSRSAKIRALYGSFQAVKLCDRIDAEAYHICGYERQQGQCRQILTEYRRNVLSFGSPEQTKRYLKGCLRRLADVEVDGKNDPIRISVIGEIYAIVEPFANLYLEDKLMELGVSSKRVLSPSWWVGDLVMKPLRLNSVAINRASRAYLPYGIGGHGKECIGEAVLAAKHRMDGAIQVYPMGCMPEVVSRAILPAISRDFGLPVMSLVVDEITGEAGYVTRIEAFVDMLRSRKRKNRPSGRAKL